MLPTQVHKFPPLLEGTLIKRYKRFMADIELASGEIITAHCPNTGSMSGVCHVGGRVMVSKSDNPKRNLGRGKYGFTQSCDSNSPQSASV